MPRWNSWRRSTGCRAARCTGHQVRLRVFDEPVQDPKTGLMSVQVAFDDVADDDAHDGVGWDNAELDPLHCGYTASDDLIVPVAMSIRRTDADMTKVTNSLTLGWFFGQSENPLDSYLSSLGYITSDSCTMSSVSDRTHNQTGTQLGTSGRQGKWSNLITYFYLPGAKRQSPERQKELLASLTIQVQPTSMFHAGDRVKVTYATPDTVRLLKGNGCLGLHQPLDLSVPNTSFTTFEEENCQPVVWSQN